MAGIPADLPGEIRGIERDAMTPDAWSRVEGHETEGLGRRCIDHFPDIDPDFVAQHRHLVHEGDVHVAKCVLQELGELGCAARRHHNDLVDELPVIERRHSRRLRRGSADDLRRVLQREFVVPRVDPLRRVREEEVASGRKTGRLEQRPNDLVGRPGVRGGLQDHQSPRTKVPCDELASFSDERKIGSVVANRGRNADEDDLGPTQLFGIAREPHVP